MNRSIVNITFRTDASLQIGTGHVMRCLTLANALRQRGAAVRFVCREHSGHLLDLIRQQGFETIALPLHGAAVQRAAEAETPVLAHASWLGTDWSTDAQQTMAGIGATPMDWLIVDHYALDARWESALRHHCRRLMVIDDLADRHHDCDLLLDQNLFGDMTVRYIEKVTTDCGLMLGPQYALLQPHYAELQPRIPLKEGPIRRILVYFGGADVSNLTGMAIAAYQSLNRDDIVLDVVINVSHPHAESLRHQIDGNTRITLHVGLPSLAPLMVQADLAIGAGGVTSWERCCLGLPTLVITLAANQIPIAAELDKLNMIRWLGESTEVNEAALTNALRQLCDVEISIEWSERCRKWVDGRGTQRVASILMLDVGTKLNARFARIDDEELMLKWVADRLALRKTIAPAETEYADHCTEFRQGLRNLEHCRLYIMETECGLPIGMVRFERLEDGWHVRHQIDILFHNRGIESTLLGTAILALRASLSGVLILCSIKETDIALHGAPATFESTSNAHCGQELAIAVCSDAHSWINPSIPELLMGWLAQSHRVAWSHSASDLPSGDICFFLSYGKIVDAQTRARFKHNLVVHESDLPHGRGWSPMSWLILEGENRIPVTLLEAVDEVDAGPIYMQDWIELTGNELGPEWRQLQATASLRLCQDFVSGYPAIVERARLQAGEPSYYPRRRPSDSELDPSKTIAEQINILRVVDNKNYPAFFEMAGVRYFLHIESKGNPL